MPAPGFFVYDRMDSLVDFAPGISIDEQVVARDNDTGKYLGRDVPQTAALAAAGGAALIGWQSAGTGAVSRTVEARMRDACSVKDFGAVGDGVTDDLAAFDAAIRHAANTTTSRGRRVLVPFGVYRLSGTLHLTRNVVLHGEAGSGNTADAGSYSGTTLLFDAGVTGIVVDRATTAPDGGRGDYSSIKDLSVQAAGKSGTAHGIQMHARASVEHCWIKNFSGNGLHIVATTPTNANNWHANDNRVEDCTGWGLYVQGNDVNAGYALGLDISLCGAGGIHDESFLGNLYSGCHVDTCNGPPYETVGSVNQSMFIRCYAEDGQPVASKIRQPSVILGGNMEFDAATTAPYLRAYSNRAFLVRNALAARNERGTFTIEGHLGYDDTSQTALAVQRWSGASLLDDYRLQYDGEEAGWFSFMQGGLQSQSAWAVSSAAASQGPGFFRVRNGLYLGSGVDKRIVRPVTARPSLGEGAPGDVAVNINTTLGGPALYVGVFNGAQTQWQDAAIIAPFDTAHTWGALQTFGAGVQMGTQLASWGAANEAPPSAADDTSGTRLLLGPGGTFQSSYKIGLEAGAMWFNSDSAFKWYRQTALLATINNTGLALAAGKTLVAPGGATIGNFTGVLGATAGVVGLADLSEFLTVQGTAFARIFYGGSEAAGDIIWSSTSHADKGMQYFGDTRLNEATGVWSFGTYEPFPGVKYTFKGDMRVIGRLIVGEEDSQADFLIGTDPEPATQYGTFSLGAGGFGDVGPAFNGNAAGTSFAINYLNAFALAGGDFMHLQNEGISKWLLKADGRQAYGVTDPGTGNALRISGASIRVDGAQPILRVPKDVSPVGSAIGRILVEFDDGSQGYLEVKSGTVTPPATVPSDNFTSADVSSINARTSSSGHTWTEIQSAAFGIIGGQLYSVSRPRAMNIAILSGQVANGTQPVKLKFYKVAGSFIQFEGIFVHRVTSDSTHSTGYIIRPNATGRIFLDYWNGTLYRNDADTATGPIAQSADGVLPDGGELQVLLGATTITVLVNGTQVIAAQTITKNLSSIEHGIGVEGNPANIGSARWDDFSGAFT